MDDYTVINTEFFRYLLFDKYMQANIGSDPAVVANTFAKWMVKLGVSTDSNFVAQYSQNIDEIKKNVKTPKMSNVIDRPNKTEPYYLTSGYATSTGGHAIGLAILPSSETKYNIYIINSGEGIKENHRVISDETGPIIIEYNDVDNTQLNDILLLNLFFKNYNISTEIKKCIKLGSDGKKKFDYDEWDKFKFGYFNYELFMENNEIVDSNLFYMFLRNIIKKEHIIKHSDALQIAGSCSFHSTYYYLKYFVIGIDSFDKFINDIKNIFLNKLHEYLIKIFIEKIKDCDNILNVCFLAIKDYDFETKEMLKNDLIKIYNNFQFSTDMSLYDYNSIPYRDIEKSSSYLNYEKITNIFNDLNNKLDNYTFLLSDFVSLSRFFYPRNRFYISCESISLILLRKLYKNMNEFRKITIAELTGLEYNPKAKNDWDLSSEPKIKVFPTFLQNTKDKSLLYIYLSYILTILDVKDEIPYIEDGISDEDVKTFFKLYYFRINKITKNEHINLHVIDFDFNDLYNKFIKYRGLFASNNIFTKTIITTEHIKILKSRSDFIEYTKKNALNILTTSIENKKYIKKISNYAYDMLQYYNFNMTNNEINDSMKYIDMMYPISYFNNDDNLIDTTIKNYCPKIIKNNEYTFQKPYFDLLNIENYFLQNFNNDDMFNRMLLFRIIHYRFNDMKIFFEKKIKDGINPNSISNKILRYICYYFSGNINNIVFKHEEYISTDYEIHANDDDFICKIFPIYFEGMKDYYINSYKIYLLTYSHNNVSKNNYIPEIYVNDTFLQLIHNNILFIKDDKVHYDSKNKFVEITSEHTNVYKNNKKELLIKSDKYIDFFEEHLSPSKLFGNHKNLLIIVTKILFSNKCYVWFNSAEKYILIEMLNNKFNCVVDVDNCYFVDDENNKYMIEQNYSFVEGLFMTNMNNGFVVTNDSKKLLMIQINSDILKKVNIITPYLSNNKINNIKIDKNNNMTNNHFLEFSYNELFFNTNNIDDLTAIILSLMLSKNGIALHLLMNKFLNILYKHKESKYVKNNDSLVSNSVFWFVHNDDIYNKIDEPLFDKRKLSYINRDRNIFDITPIMGMIEYTLIRNLSEIINKLKNDTLKSEKNPDLNDFLDEVRTACVKFTSEYSQLKENKNSIKEYYPTNIIMLQDHKNTMKNNLFRYLFSLPKNSIITLSDIYLDNCIDFYKLIFMKYFENVYKQLEKLSDEDYSCGNILKIIELLDPINIYDLSNARKIDEVLFETHTGFLLRAKQIQLLNNIDRDIIDNINDKTYEILMGQGKTSTITPMLILKNIYSGKYNTFNVILPTHLVIQSFEIINNLSYILPNTYVISWGNDMYYNYSENKINILSCSEYKLYVLNKLISNYKYIVSNNVLHIFDEVDSLIDPLKSELNKPFGETKIHDNRDILTNAIFDIIRILSGKKDIHNIETDKIKIKLYDTIIYTFNTDDNEFAIFTEAKLNSVLILLKKLIYSKDYGFGDFTNGGNIGDIIRNNKKYYIAVPYSAINQPLNDSQFSDFELSLLLTINSYMSSGLRENDILLLVNNLNNLRINNIDMFNIIIDKLNIKFVDVENAMNSLDKIGYIQDFINDIHEKYKNSDKILEYYIKNIIIPTYFEINVNQYNISTLDLFSNKIAKNKITFSGTVNFLRPSEILREQVKGNSSHIFDNLEKMLITTVKRDSYAVGSIKSSILGILTKQPKNIIYGNMDNLLLQNSLLKYIDDKMNEYNAIIDQGGILLFMKTMDFVKYLHDKNKDKKILFVDSNGIRMIYNEDETITYYNNEIFENLFIYYDHKNCIGTDFKQPNKMHGLVTIRNGDTLTNVSQAIFRLRNINVGHTIDFFCPNEIVGEDPEKLYTALVESENIYKDNTMKNSMMQIAKFVNRHINFSKSSFSEQLFYDLVKYKDTYLLKKDFHKNMLIDINKSLEKTGILVRIFDFNESNEIKVELSQEIIVEKNVERVIEKNTTVKSDKMNFILTSDWMGNLFDNILDNIMISYNGLDKSDIFDIVGTRYNIFISPTIWMENHPKNPTDSVRVVINPEKYIVMIGNNIVYILTIYDFCLVYNNLYTPNTSANIKNDYVFFDKNRKFIYGNLENEFTKTEGYDMILEFVTSCDHTKYINVFNIITKLYSLDIHNITRFKFFEKFLEITKKYSFMSETIVFDELSYKSPTIWSTIFKISDPEIIKILQNMYIKKYKPDEPLLVGGYKNDKYKKKYLKYKHKYLKLKNEI